MCLFYLNKDYSLPDKKDSLKSKRDIHKVKSASKVNRCRNDLLFLFSKIVLTSRINVIFIKIRFTIPFSFRIQKYIPVNILNIELFLDFRKMVTKCLLYLLIEVGDDDM
jgi:hypothetical protein